MLDKITLTTLSNTITHLSHSLSFTLIKLMNILQLTLV